MSRRRKRRCPYCKAFYFPDPQSYLEARKGLIEKSLIAYGEGVYQVMDLPKILINTRKRNAAGREAGLKSLKEILKKLGD